MNTVNVAAKKKSAVAGYFAFDSLKNGRTVFVRAITPADRDLLREGMHHLSKQSLYNRFFTYKDDLSEKELDYFTNVDFVNHVALLAGFYQDGHFEPAATARYIVSTDPKQAGSAELAVTVAEEYQGMGFATVLMQHLSRIAGANGLKELVGLVLPGNTKMLSVLTRTGLPFKRTLDDMGEWEIRLNLESLQAERAK
ncbi:MAG: GNAT family N-acetyltransferase [Cyanobacteria bacterium SZAS LIN-3]|nr:GNAT family N-acetyltransferase [Cyanobacteria bacterium SZAS LIN-3]MBS2009280.1 GNAT family N-acetyltransferase [Cyanobacteria bacterium SZAS TMP-1]